MSIQFEEDNFGKNPYTGIRPVASEKPTKGITGWIIKTGLASSPLAANIIQVVLALLVFALSFYFFKYGFNLPEINASTAKSPAEIRLPKPAQGLDKKQ